jgi:mitotic spindle assembly checkpoint protein MAD2B
MATPTSIPVPEAQTLFHGFTSFLTVAIHNVLYYRRIYPQATFLSVKAFNIPVHQSRHPKVCSWVSDAVEAVSGQLANGAAERVAVVIHASGVGAVLERWVFDVSRFPRWPGGEEAMQRFRQGEVDEEEEEELEQEGDVDGDASTVNFADVNEQFRGVIARMAQTGEKLAPLPEGCTFTVIVELKEDGEAPIGVCRHSPICLPTCANKETAPSTVDTLSTDRATWVQDSAKCEGYNF